MAPVAVKMMVLRIGEVKHGEPLINYQYYKNTNTLPWLVRCLCRSVPALLVIVVVSYINTVRIARSAQYLLASLFLGEPLETNYSTSTVPQKTPPQGDSGYEAVQDKISLTWLKVFSISSPLLLCCVKCWPKWLFLHFICPLATNSSKQMRVNFSHNF